MLRLERALIRPLAFAPLATSAWRWYRRPERELIHADDARFNDQLRNLLNDSNTLDLIKKARTVPEYAGHRESAGAPPHPGGRNRRWK